MVSFVEIRKTGRRPALEGKIRWLDSLGERNAITQKTYSFWIRGIWTCYSLKMRTSKHLANQLTQSVELESLFKVLWCKKKTFLIAVLNMYFDKNIKWGLSFLISLIKNISDNQNIKDPSIITHEIIRRQAMLWDLTIKA